MSAKQQSGEALLRREYDNSCDCPTTTHRASNMFDNFAAIISVLALTVSSVTAWLTLFRRGTVSMTQPTVIYFGPDASPASEAKPPPKVFLRMLLFSTSKRGRIVESMHASLTRNETRQNFNIWVYGDDKLVRGSGLFVGETGVVANHHFLTPKDGNSFRFVEGEYTLVVFAKLLGDKAAMRLATLKLVITRENATALQEAANGLYFDWGPDAGRYIPHIEVRRSGQVAEDFLKSIGLDARPSSASIRSKD